MISPALFCYYIGKLLFNLEANGIGYFIDTILSMHSHMLNIVFIAPTSRACVVYYLFVIVLLMISRWYSTLKKSKCLIFEPIRKAGNCVNQKPVFFTLDVMQLRLLTNGLILVTLLTIVLMMALILHLGVIQL